MDKTAWFYGRNSEHGSPVDRFQLEQSWMYLETEYVVHGVFTRRKMINWTAHG